MKGDRFHVDNFEVLRGKYVQWISSLAEARAADGMEENLVPDNYEVLQQDAHDALVAQILSSGKPSSKHFYVVDREELDVWILTHPAREE